ncbi:MAG: MotA/TolQ/ExbB proton channel family protein [Opitutales bacterium]
MKPRPMIVLALAGLSLAGTVAALAQEGGGPAAAQQTSDSVFSLLLRGGPVMIPLAICSILAVTLSFERLISLSRPRILPPNLRESVFTTVVKDGQRHWRHGIELCEELTAPLSRVFRTGLLKRSESRAYVEKAMSDTAALEVGKLRRSLRGLKIIATVSPLLGLLGTVAGMIRSFQTVAASTGSLGRAEMLAQGIYEAMVTTATGLSVAIPALVAYSFLFNRVDKFADAIEEEGDAFADQLQATLHNRELSDAADAPRPAPNAEATPEEERHEYSAV